MAEKFVSERNLRFLLYEVFDAESLSRYPYFNQYDRNMFDMVLKAAIELADGILWPVFQDMDRNPPELVDDQVKVHPSMSAIMQEFGQGGWIGATIPEDKGGEQLPHLIADTCQFIFMAANYSSSVYAGLCAGAADLIKIFGSKNLFNTYVPKLLSGHWQGTMALTEPEAGSSLSDIITSAEPTNEGYYKILGQKIFISAGDHDAVENVIHLMLAKIKGAPPGVKGISLFVVPKMRIDGNGKLISNDVVTSGIFHKLGYKGCPIAQLNMGDKDNCRGYLVGEPHKGLRYMFKMMNEARIGVGMGATAMATAAYYSSLKYAKIRKQGREIADNDPARLQVPIIEHADVKRMLLFQRAIIEGSISLLMQCCKYIDMQKVSKGAEKEKYNVLLEILTPVAKTYPSEMGILSISQGLQCFGGSGYCEDYPLEQYYRDARIHPIHEGTTGIHGIDLLGRKVIMHNGKAFELYLMEVWEAIEAAKNVSMLKPYAQQLSVSLEKLKQITSQLVSISQDKGPEYFLADSTLYLEFFSIIAVAWQWLLQSLFIQKALANKQSEREMQFYQGKFFTFRYFFGYELPKIEGLARRLMESDGLTIEMKSSLFND